MFTKWVTIADVVVPVTATVLPSIIHAIYCMLHGNFDANSWILLFRVDVPYGVSGLSKWLTLLFVEFYSIFGSGFVNAIVTTYFISLCFYVEAYCKHLQLEFQSINKKIKQFRKLRRINGNEVLDKIKTGLNEVVSFRCELIS